MGHKLHKTLNQMIDRRSQAESYDYLFECAVRLRSLGIDVAKPSPVMPQPVTNGQQANGHTGIGSGLSVCIACPC